MKVVLSRGSPSTIPLRGTAPLPTKQSSVGRKGARFAGYAALFDCVDRGGDVVRAGAFARAVRKESVPLLLEHRTPIGRVEMLAEDARGLRVIARTARPVAAGMGLSFGYRVRTSRGAGPRELLDLELVEVSLVKVPMQPGARVIAVE